MRNARSLRQCGPNIGCTCSRTAKSTIPQAADERKVIVPGCEIECRVKGGAERRKRVLSTIENFGGARLQASGHDRLPGEGGDFGVIETAETALSTAVGIPRAVCRTSKAPAPPGLRCSSCGRHETSLWYLRRAHRRRARDYATVIVCSPRSSRPSSLRIVAVIVSPGCR